MFLVEEPAFRPAFEEPPRIGASAPVVLVERRSVCERLSRRLLATVDGGTKVGDPSKSLTSKYFTDKVFILQRLSTNIPEIYPKY